MYNLVLNGRENVAFERAKRYIERGYSFETWFNDVDIPSRSRALKIWNVAYACMIGKMKSRNGG